MEEGQRCRSGEEQPAIMRLCGLTGLKGAQIKANDTMNFFRSRTRSTTAAELHCKVSVRFTCPCSCLYKIDGENKQNNKMKTTQRTHEHKCALSRHSPEDVQVCYDSSGSSPPADVSSPRALHHQVITAMSHMMEDYADCFHNFTGSASPGCHLLGRVLDHDRSGYSETL